MNTPGLKLVHLNCRSIYNKLDQIILLYRECDIICISETWLNSKFTDQILQFPGKKLYRFDRTHNTGNVKGGCVCIYIDEKYGPYCTINMEITSCTPDYKILCLDASLPNHKYMSIICMYRPPRGNIKYLLPT